MYLRIEPLIMIAEYTHPMSEKYTILLIRQNASMMNQQDADSVANTMQDFTRFPRMNYCCSRFYVLQTIALSMRDVLTNNIQPRTIAVHS